MCHLIYNVFIFCFVVWQCYALNCRSDGGPKEADLKAMYSNCLKKQDGHNSTDNRGHQGDQDRKESRGVSHHKKQWNRDLRDRYGESGMDDRNDKMNRDRMSSRDDMMHNRDQRMGNRGDKMNRDDRMGGRDDRMEGRDHMDRHHMMDKGEDFGNQFNDRQNYPRNGDFDSGMHGYNNGQYSTSQSPRRFRRSKRIENSGQRSQYNPNSKKPTEYDDTYQDDDRNSSDSSKDMDNKACALHCFMEQLEMTGDDGMPDKYLVTHSITKDVKNEDLRDFLQESIEECFQILDNENTEDKCEFAKNLMMCLSEKGRANCDDWKDDLKF